MTALGTRPASAATSPWRWRNLPSGSG